MFMTSYKKAAIRCVEKKMLILVHQDEINFVVTELLERQ